MDDEYGYNSEYDNKKIRKASLEELENILDKQDNSQTIEKLSTKSLIKALTYSKVRAFYEKLENLYFDLTDWFKRIDLDQYLSETIDIQSLREIYKKQNLEKEFGKFNFKRLKQLYENPIESLKSPIYNEDIIYDRIVVRKYVVAIIQMVFNKMDLMVAFCGREGTGKTTASTQDSYLVYWLLQELGLVKYEFDLKGIMRFNLQKMIDGFNEHSDTPFRISILDEGNELNRKNWNNPLVELFFQKLRRERKHLRIVFINLPQIGELVPSITLSRVNFIFQLEMRGNIKNKLAEKGECRFFIIPRFPTVYSYILRKELRQADIINEMGNILDDKKKYLTLLPRRLSIKNVKRNGVWAFDERKYDRASKYANEQFSTNVITLTKTEMFYLAKYLNLKYLGIKPQTKAYHALNDLKNKKLRKAVKSDEFDTFREADAQEEDED